MDLTQIKDSLRFKKSGQVCFVHCIQAENFTLVYITDQRLFYPKDQRLTYMKKHGFVSYRDACVDLNTVQVRAWEYSIACIPGLREVDGHWITDEERHKLGGTPIP
jgi:hypothetical protein